VTQRFQIEDLIAQDASGVVFRALDMTTDVVVAVRRFFPFGADGDGLNEEQQTAYNIAVGRLAGLDHPSMRSVICGGCDAIDGMPYIATEWIPGKTLATFIKNQPLKPAEAINVLTQALEVSELLSRVLAEEGIWVETDVQTIVVGDEGTGRGVTFWIAPLKWMSRSDEPGSMDSIITLTEEIMGWKGQTVGDNAGRRLGDWLKWLRQASKTTTLGEAREMLAASTGMEPPTPSKQLVRQAAARPSVPIKAIKARKKKSINGMLVTIILLFLVAGGLVGWAIYRKDPHEPKTSGGLAELAAQMAKEDTRKLSESAASAVGSGLSPELREVAAAMRESEKDDEPGKKEEVAAAEPAPSPASSSGGVFSPNDPRILQQEGQDVIVEGVVAKLDYSKSGKTLYLLFSDKPKVEEARGAILISKAGPDLNEAALTPLVGKKVRLSGRLELQKVFTNHRPEVGLANRAAIEVIP